MMRRVCWCCMSGVLVLAVQAAATTAAAVQAAAGTAQELKQTADSLSLVRDGKVVWQFNYAPKQTKPFIHPLALADGTALTWKSPPDHVWHYGLWFSWKYINGVNYWEENLPPGQRGLTRWKDVQVERSADGSAAVTMELSYQPPDGAAVLRERRQMRFSEVDESGAYHIDWSGEFEALADRVTLDRTPLPGEPNGKPHGGYAGLSYRAHAQVRDRQYVTADGPFEMPAERHRLRAEALEFSAAVNGKVFGLAMLDHPENLRSPTPWFVIRFRTTDFVSPAPLMYSPHVMTRGERFTLRYRIFVHEGRWDAAELRRRHEQFVAEQAERNAP